MVDYLSLISAIPSLMSNFSGSANPYAKQQQQLAGNQLQASNALIQGSSNPLYQSIFNQYKQQNANNAAQTIAEAQGQNRMNANMGRTPLFSNERGSENIFRTLMQQQQGAGVQADQQTRAALGQAGTSGLQGIAGYNAMLPQTNMATAQGLQGYKDIYSLLRGQTGQQTPYNPGPVSWNQPSSGSMGAGNYSPTYAPAMPGYTNPNTNLYQQPPAYSGFQY
jgi:hypothetical protein